ASGPSPALTQSLQRLEQKHADLRKQEQQASEHLAVERERLTSAKATAASASKAFDKWVESAQHAPSERNNMAALLREHIESIRLIYDYWDEDYKERQLEVTYKSHIHMKPSHLSYDAAMAILEEVGKLSKPKRKVASQRH